MDQVIVKSSDSLELAEQSQRECVYVLPFRGGEVLFTDVNDEWEVSAYGKDGSLLWSVADPFLNARTFGEARKQGREEYLWRENI